MCLANVQPHHLQPSHSTTQRSLTPETVSQWAVPSEVLGCILLHFSVDTLGSKTELHEERRKSLVETENSPVKWWPPGLPSTRKQTTAYFNMTTSTQQLLEKLGWAASYWQHSPGVERSDLSTPLHSAPHTDSRGSTNHGKRAPGTDTSVWYGQLCQAQFQSEKYTCWAALVCRCKWNKMCLHRISKPHHCLNE